MKLPFSRWVLYTVFAFLYLPVLILFIYSFNDSRFALTWSGFTLKWYRALFASAEVSTALKNTLIVSLSATTISAVLGTLLGVGMHLYHFPGKRMVEFLIYLPVVIPDLLMAISLLAFYVAVHLTLGHFSIVLAHVSFQVSFVALVVKSRMQDFPANLLEAARDLGANQFQVLYHIILPLAGPGILAGTLIAFTLSVDDFLITYFTAGVGASTLPVRIYSMVKRGVTPDINALSSLILIFTFVTMYTGLKLLYKPSKPLPETKPVHP
ncbi:MAG: ABC transporter permease [bacterium]|nr:ABC transporter permease [bacterium]